MAVTDTRRTAAHEAALALLPELADHRPPDRRPRHVVARVLASVAALVLVVAVVGTALAVSLRSSDQFVREDVPAASLSPDELAQYSRWAASAPARPAAPIVLTYHDIQPDPVASPYVVSPDAFARQMAMLQAAGYRSLTADQFLAYRRGTFTPPPRSVLLTFDDGTAGLWRYADSVLQRYGFTAVSFVITGRVGTAKPYYLTWDLIERMHASGRWDFESHTANLHTRVPVSPGGPLGGALSHRMIIGGHLESQAQFEARVRKDLLQSISDLTSHGLPRPELFAYPFSDVVAKGMAGREAAVPRSIVSELFPVAFVDVEPGALPASLREVRKQVISRAEVFHKDDERSVFRRLQQMATLSVSSLDPLRVDHHWFEDGSAHPAPVEVVGDRLVVDARTETYVAGSWAPQRTSDWVGYTVSCRVEGLLPDGRTGAGITVRVGSDRAIVVRVSEHALQVSASDRPIGGPVPLRSAPSHVLQVMVREDATVVAVDGITLARIPSAGGPATYGGFGVSASRKDTTVAFPTFVGLRVGRAT
jgi:peptidoglycan/xylan/chitin deacetylase (PgdA/CDA1 family)